MSGVIKLYNNGNFNNNPVNDGPTRLDADVEDVSYQIKNGLIHPVNKCYKITLPANTKFSKNNGLTFRFRLPKTLVNGGDLYYVNGTIESATASLFIKGSNQCEESNDTSLNVDVDNNSCGNIVFTLNYTVQNNINNVCEILYSICFKPVSVINKLSKCVEYDPSCTYEHFEYSSKPCLSLSLSGAASPGTIILEEIVPIDGNNYIRSSYDGLETHLYYDIDDSTVFLIGANSKLVEPGNTYDGTDFSNLYTLEPPVDGICVTLINELDTLVEVSTVFNEENITLPIGESTVVKI